MIEYKMRQSIRLSAAQTIHCEMVFDGSLGREANNLDTVRWKDRLRMR